MPTPNPEFDAALHRRLYVEQDPSRLVAATTAAATAPAWTEWRKAMNAAVKDRRPNVTTANGDIRLQAKGRRVHAQSMRYEPQSNKNVLGFWTNAADWADWEFEVETPGTYEVEVQQGCGKGSGGAEVARRNRESDPDIHSAGYRPFSEYDPADHRSRGTNRRSSPIGGEAPDQARSSRDGLAPHRPSTDTVIRSPRCTRGIWSRAQKKPSAQGSNANSPRALLDHESSPSISTACAARKVTTTCRGRASGASVRHSCSSRTFGDASFCQMIWRPASWRPS